MNICRMGRETKLSSLTYTRKVAGLQHLCECRIPTGGSPWSIPEPLPCRSGAAFPLPKSTRLFMPGPVVLLQILGQRGQQARMCGLQFGDELNLQQRMLQANACDTEIGKGACVMRSAKVRAAAMPRWLSRTLFTQPVLSYQHFLISVCKSQPTSFSCASRPYMNTNAAQGEMQQEPVRCNSPASLLC